jgi:hypothetical protein
MKERLFELPRIASVEGEQPPFWSVMIPTFNCAKYLRKTLKSVLAQELGETNRQIKDAVDEFFAYSRESPIVLPTGQAVLLKLPEK